MSNCGEYIPGGDPALITSVGVPEPFVPPSGTWNLTGNHIVTGDVQAATFTSTGLATLDSLDVTLEATFGGDITLDIGQAVNFDGDGATPGNNRIYASADDTVVIDVAGTPAASWDSSGNLVGVADIQGATLASVGLATLDSASVTTTLGVTGIATLSGGIAQTYAAAADAHAIALATHADSQALVVTEDNVARAAAMIDIIGQASRTGTLVKATSNGAAECFTGTGLGSSDTFKANHASSGNAFNASLSTSATGQAFVAGEDSTARAVAMVEYTADAARTGSVLKITNPGTGKSIEVVTGDVDVTAGVVSTGDGDTTSPAYGFAGQAGLGWYNDTNSLRAAAGAAAILAIDGSRFVMFINGAEATPSVVVGRNDQDSGFWSPGDNIVALSTNSTEAWRVDATQNTTFAGDVTLTAGTLSVDGAMSMTGANPGITYQGDTTGSFSGLSFNRSVGTLVGSINYGDTSASAFTNELVMAGRLAGVDVVIYSGATVECARFDSDQNVLLAGKLGVGVGASANMDVGDMVLNGGALVLAERATPTPDANFGKIYTKSSNQLFFQDGGGTEHAISASEPAFSSLWFHGPEDETTISTQALFTKVTNFNNEGPEDDTGLIVGDSTTNDDITIGAGGAGASDVVLGGSFRTSGATSQMLIAVGVTLATPISITSSVDATPIVVTSTAHGLKDGDMVRISGHTTNIAVNADAIVDSKTDNTFELLDLNGVAITTTGAGAGSGGNVDTVFPGDAVIHRGVATTYGNGANEGTFVFAVGDVAEMYVANLDSTTNYFTVGNSFKIRRIQAA